MFALFACFVCLFGFVGEDDFLSARFRRGGFLKLIEQIIGWQLFVFLMGAFALWCLNYGVVSIWKVIDGSPDVKAWDDRIEFHPAVKRTPVSYSDVQKWTLEHVSGHPVLRIYLKESYWSLQGLFKRRTIKLEGGKEDLEPLFSFFVSHHYMSERFERE
jgi:hypothetical protein